MNAGIRRIGGAVVLILSLLAVSPADAGEPPSQKDEEQRPKGTEEQAPVANVAPASPEPAEESRPSGQEPAAEADVTAPEATAEVEPSVVLEEILVVVKRYDEEAARATPSIDRIGRRDIDRTQSPELAASLSELPGVLVEPGAVPGQASLVSIRGAARFHTLVLLDGIPMNNSANAGVFNFSGFTTSAVESVEVLRGSYSLLYGSEAIGGLISINTRKGRGSPNGFVHLEGGSFSTHREVLGFDAGGEEMDIALTVSNLQSAGNGEREDFRTTEFVTRLGMDLSERVRLESTVYYGDSEYQVPFAGDTRPGGPLPREPNEESATRRLAGGLNLFAGPADWCDIRLHASVLDENWTWDDGANEPTSFDPDGEPGSGDEFEQWIDEFHGERIQTDYRVRGSGTLYLNEIFDSRYADEGGLDFELIVGGEYVTQKTRETQVFPDPGATTGPAMRSTFIEDSIRTWSWFVLGQVVFPDGDLFENGVVNAGFRRDDNSAFGTANSPFAGARVTLAPTGTVIRSAYGEGFRAPRVAELYNNFIGNPELGPETSKSFDVGILQPLFDGRLGLSLTWFQLDLENGVFLNASTWKLDNFPEGTRNRGWEFGLGADLGAGFRLRGALTHQDRRNPAGKQIAVPRYGSFGLSWADPSWLVSLDGFYSAGRAVLTRTYTDPDPDERANPGRRTLVQIAGRYRVSERVSLFARVENLLNDKYVISPTGSLGLPRGFFMGGRIDF